MRLSDISHALLDAAKKAGADAADCLVVNDTHTSIDVLKGKLEQAERSEAIDLGLRVFVGRQQACVSASDPRQQTIAEMAERAVAMAREAPEDPFARLAEEGEYAQSYDVAALELHDASAQPSPSDLQDWAQRAEAAALDIDGISQVSAANSVWGAREIHLATSNGFEGGYERSTFGTSVVAITGEGLQMERDFYGDYRSHLDDLETPEAIGQEAAKRTLQRTNAQKPPTGAYPVLFDERVSSTLMNHLLGAINGISVARGATFLGDHLGALVLPEGIDLIEDPTLPRRTGSRPFDAEGLCVSKRALVQDGVLQSWVLDLATASQLGMQSTANAARGTGAPPSPSVTNVAMTQGDQSPQELMRDMGTGLVITSMIGSSINPTTGDYSRGASGYWVENGEIAYAVNECTVAGNLKDMLRSIVPANDARSHLSRVVPSLLVEGLTIAGK